jgi:hypothetical protein
MAQPHKFPEPDTFEVGGQTFALNVDNAFHELRALAEGKVTHAEYLDAVKDWVLGETGGAALLKPGEAEWLANQVGLIHARRAKYFFDEISGLSSV